MRTWLPRCSPLLLCGLLASVASYTQLPKLYVNPKFAGNEKQSRFINIVQFIPLQTPAGFSVSQYSNVVVTENFFLITTYSSKTTAIFSKSGVFIKNINFKPLGEGFFPGYDEHDDRLVFFGHNKNYSLTLKDEIKIMQVRDSPRNKKYFKKYVVNLNDGSFALQKATPDEYDIIKANPLYDDYYFQSQVTASPLYKDSIDYEFEIYNNHQLVKRYFPYNRISEPRFLYQVDRVAYNKTGNPSVYFLTRPYCDTIYKLDKDSLYPVYKLVLPLENTLPPSFFTTPFKSKTERENFDRNNGWMLHQVFNVYETPRIILFSLWFLSNYKQCLYLKETGTTYQVKNIKPDSTQYNLSLLSEFGIWPNGNTFYQLIKAGDLQAFFKQNPTAPVPKELQGFLNNKPAAEAPVIVAFTFKN